MALEVRRYKTNVTCRIWMVTKFTGCLRNYVKYGAKFLEGRVTADFLQPTYIRQMCGAVNRKAASCANSKKKQSLYRHGQALRGHRGANVVNRPPLLSRKYPWYSFLSEAESIPGPEGLVNEKLQ